MKDFYDELDMELQDIAPSQAPSESSNTQKHSSNSQSNTENSNKKGQPNGN